MLSDKGQSIEYNCSQVGDLIIMISYYHWSGHRKPQIAVSDELLSVGLLLLIPLLVFLFKICPLLTTRCRSVSSIVAKDKSINDTKLPDNYLRIIMIPRLPVLQKNMFQNWHTTHDLFNRSASTNLGIRDKITS